MASFFQVNAVREIGDEEEKQNDKYNLLHTSLKFAFLKYYYRKIEQKDGVDKSVA